MSLRKGRGGGSNTQTDIPLLDPQCKAYMYFKTRETGQIKRINLFIEFMNISLPKLDSFM